MVDIVSRAQWGAKPWSRPSDVIMVPSNSRTEFLVHYHGGLPPIQVGPAVPRDCEAIHLAEGWIGIGYNFVVDQAGTAYEGRGWDIVGAHCPGHNRLGLGVYVAVGGDEIPSDAALRTVRALYDEGCRLSGNVLRKTWHGANYATECPGQHLIDWVKAGMPTPTEDDMPLSDDDIDRIVERFTSDDKALFKVHDDARLVTITDALSDVIARLEAISADVQAIKAAKTV